MSRINLTDTADAIAAKIRKARTDPEPLPETLDGLAERPEVRNLVGIYAALAGTSAEAVVTEFAGQGFGAFKPALAELAVNHLTPITAEMTRLMADPAEIDRVLGDGANRAAELADPILAETYDKVGFLRSR
jgi:tryptophanyl-tRNA synthetase